MPKRVLSDVAYTVIATEARTRGSATHAGEARQKRGEGLDPLVDPSGGSLYGPIRRSLSRFELQEDCFILPNGTPMLKETRLDTTGSMGDNVEIAMRVLPTGYKLLAIGSDAVLGRYDLQMITSIFGDVQDYYVLCRSQAEMDVEIARQMTLMLPEHGGFDEPEDPQYGLFGGAFLTSADINKYGLKYYDITVSDAPGRDLLTTETLVRVFGDSVFEKVTENGYQINSRNLPSTKEVVESLSYRAHAFFLQVGVHAETTRFWKRIYGDRLVTLPDTELLPYMEAAIIGLTEGLFDLQSTEEYLRRSNVSQVNARAISRALVRIPVGAQAVLPNFNKIPLAGAKFAKKGDLWPIGHANASVETVEPDEDDDTPPEDKDMWL